MSTKAGSERTVRTLVYLALLIQVAAIVYSLSLTASLELYTVVRAAALLGYVGLFWLIVSSEYVREMRKVFGRVYLKVHHPLAVVTWVLIVAHPLSYALLVSDPKVLLPVLWPLRRFLELGGRAALYLFALASVTAIVRRSLKKSWRYVHRLSFLAFPLVFIHAWLIGSDLISPLLQVIWVAMAVVVLVITVHKVFLRGRSG